MKENTTAVAINLMECNEFTTKIDCSLPGNGTDVRRPFSFTATFNLVAQDEYEDLADRLPKSEVVRALLKSVSGVPAGVLPDGTQLTPEETAIRNPITCDALSTAFWLYTGYDGRAAALSATDRKNWKRSAKR